jgi:thiamine-phosphate pyrophosphorylase
MRELGHIRQAVDLPIVVIGGINKENAGLFRGRGIDGLAVVSAILAQPDMRLAAAELKRLFVPSRKEG